ncbi:MAG: alpha/beta hydrolase-fold protein, partial [Candidatus Korobacteraceae bacterium]
KDGAADEKNLLGKEYARFLTTEVMPFIEKRYRISRGAMNTGVGGSSYGGDIALYTALEYPGVFGHVLVESPELWIGKKQLLKDAENARQLPHKMYLGIGTAEASEPIRSAEIVNQVRELENTMLKKSMGAGRLRVMIEESGQHNEAAWSRRLPDALLFLYGQ